MGLVIDPEASFSFFLGADWCARENFSVVARGMVGVEDKDVY